MPFVDHQSSKAMSASIQKIAKDKISIAKLRIANDTKFETEEKPHQG